LRRSEDLLIYGHVSSLTICQVTGKACIWKVTASYACRCTATACRAYICQAEEGHAAKLA